MVQNKINTETKKLFLINAQVFKTVLMITNYG